MRELFVPKNFSKSTLKTIEFADLIIGEYQKQGFTLTLRQLYYQFVARGLMDNKQSEYKRLGGIISDARLAGLIDWSAIEDRTRNLRGLNHWESPAELVESISQDYREDLWQGQRYRPEVWIEKDALLGVIEYACQDLRTNYFACRGYTSQSELYNAGKRFARYKRGGQKPIVFHLGDHDPSGIDMTRDNGDRLRMFASFGVEVRRLALNFEQVERYNPPPNPAKETDSRSGNYIVEYGTKSWELDALDPQTIDKLVRDNIEDLINKEIWDEMKQAEELNRASLEMAAANWEDLSRYIHDNYR